MEEKVYTIHCTNCLAVLGITKKKIQKELEDPEIYCLRCAKDNLNPRKDGGQS